MKLRIQRIYNYIDGFAYMSKFVKNLKKVGTSYKACCPFHNEKTPSFTIYPKNYLSASGPQDHDSFYCFGCNAGGDIIKFYELLYNVSRETAIARLEKEFNIFEDINLSLINTEIKKIQTKSITLLNFAEVNLLISNTCRKYLELVKIKYNTRYEYEKKLIDHYYRYIDYILPNCNDYEANLLYQKIQKKLNKRRERLNEAFYRSF